MKRLAYMLIVGAFVSTQFGAAAAQTVTYTFTPIAQFGVPLPFGLPRSFAFPTDINNDGLVSFSASTRRPNTVVEDEGIFTGDGLVTNTIVDSISGPIPNGFPSLLRSLIHGHGALNEAGTVAFSGGTAAIGEQSEGKPFGVFTGSGGPLTTITTGQGGVPTAINAAGYVAFTTTIGCVDMPFLMPPVCEYAIMTGNGGTPTTVVDTNGPFKLFRNVIGIDDGGRVFFLATLDDGSSGIFTSDGTTIADSRGSFASFGAGRNAINDAGLVVFHATLDDGSSGIFTSDGVTVTPIADTNGAFSELFTRPAINNAGQVAFGAVTRSNGRIGIFTGADPIANAVIHVFNTHLVLGGLNDSGQISFSANLGARGDGIFRADPEQQNVPPREFTINVTTFIPGNNQNTQLPCRLRPPQGIHGTVFVRYDDRGFNADASTFRTRQRVTVIPDAASDSDGLKEGSKQPALAQSTKLYGRNALPIIDDADDDARLFDCHLLHEEVPPVNVRMTIDDPVRIGPHQLSIHLFGQAGTGVLGFGRVCPINWDFTVFLDDTPGLTPTAQLVGAHDGFPAYEVYVNGASVYFHRVGSPPYRPNLLSRLCGPLGVRVATPLVTVPAGP